MAIRVQWGDPSQTHIRWDAEGHLTLDQLRCAMQQVDLLVKDVDHRFDVILYNQGAISADVSLQQLKWVMQYQNPKQRYMAVVDRDSTLTDLLRAVQQMQQADSPFATGDSILFAKTLEQAYAMLAQKQPLIAS